MDDWNEPFEPWNRARPLLPVRLPIAAPPCARCKFWSPVAVSNTNGQYDGVRLCHAQEQERDFSCFKYGPPII